jgi:hypothetical protein
LVHLIDWARSGKAEHDLIKQLIGWCQTWGLERTAAALCDEDKRQREEM